MNRLSSLLPHSRRAFAAAAFVSLASIAGAATYGNGVPRFSTPTKASLPSGVPTTTYTAATKDNAGIQAAINAAANAGGGVVSLASGVHTLNAQVTLKDKVTLKGAGQGSTILRRGSGFTSVMGNDQLDNGLLRSNDAALNDVTVVDLTVDGGYTRAQLESIKPGFYGIWISSPSTTAAANIRIRCHNIEVKGCGMGVGSSGTTHWTFTGGNYHDNGSLHYFHNIYLRRCGVININGITSKNANGSGVKIAGGTFSIPGESQHVLIEKSTITNNDYNNVYIAGIDSARIANNTLNAGDEIHSDATGNAGGIICRDEGGRVARFVDIVNNIVQNNRFNGIKVWNCDQVGVQGNRSNTNGTNYNIVTSVSVTCDNNTL